MKEREKKGRGMLENNNVALVTSTTKEKEKCGFNSMKQRQK